MTCMKPEACKAGWIVAFCEDCQRIKLAGGHEAAARAEGYTVKTFADDPGKFYWQRRTGDAHAPIAVAFKGEDTKADAWRAACVDAELIKDDTPPDEITRP